MEEWRASNDLILGEFQDSRTSRFISGKRIPCAHYLGWSHNRAASFEGCKNLFSSLKSKYGFSIV
jgi:hypothetical protein